MNAFIKRPAWLAVTALAAAAGFGLAIAGRSEAQVDVAPAPEPAEWKVIPLRPTEAMGPIANTAILLNTRTGETWSMANSSQGKDNWMPIDRD